MKKLCVCCIAMISIVICSMASASEMMSIVEIKNLIEKAPRWQKTYNAHNRTIDVDIPIIVPNVESFPVVKVEGRQVIAQGKVLNDLSITCMTEEDENLIKYSEEGMISYLTNGQYNDSGEITVLSPNNEKSVFFKADYQSPSHLRTDKVKYKEISYYPYEINEEELHAEDNDMSIQDAENYLRDILRYFFGEDNEIEINFVELRSRGHRVKNLDDTKLGDYISDYNMGTYYMKYYQKINGIPVFNDVGERLDTTGFDPEKIVDEVWNKSEPIRRISDNRFEIMTKNSFELVARWLKPIGIIENDVPLVSLEDVIKSIENEIQSGHIRRVYALRLGYGCYVTNESPEAFVLYPIWICDCDYFKNAKEEPNEKAYKDITNFRERYSFKSLVIDAQKATMNDIWLTKRKEMFCPDIITWEDLR